MGIHRGVPETFAAFGIERMGARTCFVTALGRRLRPTNKPKQACETTLTAFPFLGAGKIGQGSARFPARSESLMGKLRKTGPSPARFQYRLTSDGPTFPGARHSLASSRVHPCADSSESTSSARAELERVARGSSPAGQITPSEGLDSGQRCTPGR